MACPRCGHETGVSAQQCPACGMPLGDTTVATGVIPVDTTGLPDGASFGPSSGLGPTLGESIPDGTTMGATAAGGRAAARGPLHVGQGFGPRYHIIKVLGVGGMGAVYQAWDAELSVAVALKVIRTSSRHQSASAAAEKRFKQELLLARQVTHKNVVRIHDLGEIEGVKYITMPYIQGHDLASVLRREKKLPIARSLHLARQIAGGLEAAHEAGVVHRDLKPANVMIGAEDTALIMDFGISASSDQAAGGEIIGTLEYMAPEQSMGEAVDSRADIYAFGMILYEMLAGVTSTNARTVQERIAAMRKRTTEGLPPLRELDETIPEPLADIVMRCLERDPAARFQTTTELVGALNRLDDAGEPIPLPARISKRALMAASVLIVALLAGMYIVGKRAVPLPPKAHDPVSVVIADIQNRTGDAAFTGTLEPMLKLALEGAGFISAFDRNGIARSLGVKPPAQLDEQAALELAVKQGVGVVLSGSLEREGTGYNVSVKAAEAVTGNVITTAQERASSKEQVVSAAARLVEDVRKALGDETSESALRFATQTFSATSLEVVREYAAGAEALSRSKNEDALRSFSKAAQLDKNFGLAYAGMAIASRNMDRHQDAEKYANEAVSHLDSMTARERYRTRGLYYYITKDYQACEREYKELIDKYAADAPARNNLALCRTHLRKLPEALSDMQQVIRILPKRTLYRENLALYAAYSSDPGTAVEQAREAGETSLFGSLALAFAQMLEGQLTEATATYQRLAKIDEELGASYTASGLGDLAVYEGRFSDAVRIYSQGAAADLSSKQNERAADKYSALAYAQLLRNQKAAAIGAADKALANSRAVKTRFLAARIFVEAGASAKASTLASGLASELLVEPQAYGKIIEGQAALKRGDARAAIKTLLEANAVLDTWIGRYELGRAYLAANAFTQADSEFDQCIARRGEAVSLFLDEEPTFAFFPTVYYYQGRVREELKNARFATSYRVYLNIRGESKEDPLVAEVRRRTGE